VKFIVIFIETLSQTIFLILGTLISLTFFFKFLQYYTVLYYKKDSDGTQKTSL